MLKQTLLNKYMQYNKILISSISIKDKKISVYQEDEVKVFSYDDFFDFFAEYFGLVKYWVKKSKVIFENITSSTDNLEIETDFTKINGSKQDYIFRIIKQDEENFYLFVNELEASDYSSLDQLTKANSKKYIDNRAKRNLLTNTPYVLVYIDVDNFKHINDEFGQLIGDMILIEMVAAIKEFLGDKGAISRIRGDAFLLMHEMEEDYDKVHAFLFSIYDLLRRLPSCTSRGINFTVTMGSSQYPKDGEYEELLIKCQKALIRGKNKGRACFVMYTDERCQHLSLTDEIKFQPQMKRNSSKNDLYSLVADINQMLSADEINDKIISQALSLIGSYFYLDRISIARLNIKTNLILKHHTWFNQKLNVKYDVYCINDIIKDWAKALGTKNYIQVDDVSELDSNYPILKYMKKDHTKASISFEMVSNNKSYGIIRYEMTTGPRHWQPEDFQAFMLLSQLFTSYFQKNYLRTTNYRVLYFDPIFNCYNFTKFFQDAGEFVLSSNNLDYSVLELNIKNILYIKRLIGELRLDELVNLVVETVNKYSKIYGKRQEGAFMVFFDHRDLSKIEAFVDEIKAKFEAFAEELKINSLITEIGVAFGNSIDDALIDIISNASFARKISNDNIVYYTDDIKATQLHQTEMCLKVDEAIKNGEFLLYMQPKFDTKTKTLIGAEALSRWNYNFEGILEPIEFIPILEEHGLIEKLDFYVFEMVCKYQRSIIDEGKNPVVISVNVSRNLANLDNYLLKLENIRNKYDIPTKYFEIEITEGMYYENAFYVSKFIDKLHSLGYKVAMDDFGAGYSNLVSIAKFNFDTIKFDKSFCLDLNSGNVKVMLEKLIELIKHMNMKTLCEGVETKEIVDFLTNIGCDTIQGFYYSKAIPYDEFKKKYQS